MVNLSQGGTAAATIPLYCPTNSASKPYLFNRSSIASMDAASAWRWMQDWFGRNDSVLTFLLSMTALVIAVVSLRYSFRVPILTEAQVEHSRELRKGIGHWRTLVPRDPPRDRIHVATMADPLRRQLEADAAFADVLEYHRPSILNGYEGLQDRLASAEADVVSQLNVIGSRLAAIIEGALGLRRPPTHLVTDVTGAEQEEEVDRAVDVYWPGLIDLLLAELVLQRVTGQLEDAANPWWEQPWTWRTLRPEWEDEELGIELRWTTSEADIVLCAVSQDRRDEIERKLFSTDLCARIHNDLATQRSALLEAHDAFRTSSEKLDEKLAKLAILPVFPGQECPLIIEAVTAVRPPQKAVRLRRQTRW